MSGSAPGMENKCEPNLTPLLDVVLQLVMFFMLCANFVMESVNESIKLPTALEAKALDTSVNNYIILNLSEKGQVLLSKNSTDVLSSQVMVKNYMKTQYEIDKARTKAEEWSKGKGRSLVILRAHKKCDFKMVHDVMAACRQAGYHDVQLRAIRGVPTS